MWVALIDFTGLVVRKTKGTLPKILQARVKRFNCVGIRDRLPTSVDITPFRWLHTRFAGWDVTTWYQSNWFRRFSNCGLWIPLSVMDVMDK